MLCSLQEVRLVGFQKWFLPPGNTKLSRSLKFSASPKSRSGRIFPAPPPPPKLSRGDKATFKKNAPASRRRRTPGRHVARCCSHVDLSIGTEINQRAIQRSGPRKKLSSRRLLRAGSSARKFLGSPSYQGSCATETISRAAGPPINHAFLSWPYLSGSDGHPNARFRTQVKSK